MRDKLNDDLNKIPQFPKKKIQIDKRKNLEIEIENYNNKINSEKLKLRKIKNYTKEF